MFLKFKSNEERREYGGTQFIEMQYCKMPVDTPDADIVSVCATDHWDLTSLYIYDDENNTFYPEYKEILGDGLYNNMREGSVDLYGINYYNAEKTERIMQRLEEAKPKGYETFLRWLKDNLYGNGFYILGL